MFTWKNKRVLCLFLAIVTVIGMSILPTFAKEESNPETVAFTILYTNDMHGNVVSNDSTIGADYIAAIKASISHAILVDSGDATQGTPISTLTDGADVIEIMNQAGYDGMVTGNHEYDYGTEQLLSNAEAANFPIVAANTIFEGKPLLADVPYQDGEKTNNGQNFIVEQNGKKIGFFGIITPDTANGTNPKGIVGITFEDAVTTALEQIALLKAENVDFMVALTHIGVDPSSSITSEKIAEKLKGSGLNAILDGHSHTPTYQKTVGDIVIVQTGTANKYIGKMDVSFDKDGIPTIVNSFLDRTAVAGAYTPNADVTAYMNTIVESQKELLEPVIGVTATSLWGGTINTIAEPRIGETNLGDLVTDAIVDGVTPFIKGTKYENSPVVALFNGGGIRATIPEGDITVGDILSVLPFGNTYAYKAITPSILYAILERGVSGVEGQNVETGVFTGYSGKFPQISGMRFEYDPNAEAGNRILAIYLDGETEMLDKTDEKTVLVFGTNDYMIAGGDGYSMLIGLHSIGEGEGVDQLLIAYIQKLCDANQGYIRYPLSQGRITAISAYQPVEKYNVTITVHNRDGVPVANTAVAYSIDYNAVVKGTTDEKGLLTVSFLSDGAHTLTVEDADTVYVNNYSGNGIMIPITIAITTEENSTDGIREIEGIDQLVDALLAELEDTDLMKTLIAEGFTFEAPIKRVEFIAILANSVGIDLENYRLDETIFCDVAPDDLFAKELAWALECGLVIGDGGKFDPNGTLTREDLSVILVRFLQAAGMDLSQEDTTLFYTDADAISDYAQDAVALLQGVALFDTTDGTFQPFSAVSFRESIIAVVSIFVATVVLTV